VAPRGRRLGALAALSAGCLALAAACTSGGTTQPSPTAGPPFTLRVLASSELADMLPILDRARQATGVTVKLTYTGTLAGTNTVLSGQADGAYDAIWFASGNYLGLSPGGLAKLDASTPIMSSPVLLGLREPVAQQLGWIGKPVSWAHIADAAAAHEFTFGMTDPSRSNSGFSAIASVAAVLVGQGAALQASQIPAAEPALRGLFGAQVLKRESSGWLADAYVREQATAGEGAPPVDGLIDYESVLLSLNASGKLHQQLALIYPAEGAITANYPLSLLASASAAAKNAYTRLVSYLRTPAVQRQIMQQTRRRPATPGVKLDPVLANHPLTELPFPGTIGVVNDLLDAYNAQLRRPARTVYVLDISGSMAGGRIAGLKAALAYLTGADASSAGQASQFQEREQVIMIPFNTAPDNPQVFDIPAQNPDTVLAQIHAYADTLSAGGGTAIYSALEAAYTMISQEAAADPDWITTIVLLTDGENNQGDDLHAFTAFYDQMPKSIAVVPVFPILFGEAQLAQMQAIATLTGGQVFDARIQPLTLVFAAISGNQ
jgi:Ca-activated chloride channel family protein